MISLSISNSHTSLHTRHGYPMDISRPDRPSSLWRDRDWTNRIWYMNQNKTVSSSSNNCLVVSTYYYYSWPYSDTVNFLLFLGCWTAFIAVPYLTFAPIHFPRLAHHYVIPGIEVVTMIFWFAGFIAMGSQLPPPRWCHSSTCSSLQAATIFGAFEW